VSAQQHNGDVAGDASTLSRQLAGRDLQYLWFNDSEARAFLASHCPQALGAYDCLLPKPYVAASIAANPRNSRARHDRSCLCSPGQLDSLFFSSLPRACMLLPLCGYKADVFRCALWAMGGVYYDAEDVLLEPLACLVRPCDELVLVRDRCPVSVLRGMSVAERLRHFSIARGTVEEWKRQRAKPLRTQPCPYASVQISFLAAVRRHPFFACCLELAIRKTCGRATTDRPSSLRPALAWRASASAASRSAAAA